jgi:hypothetical protein
METFTIRNFKPIEGKEDATDQDRGVLRICEGVAPVPQGALCAGPQWKPLWGKTDGYFFNLIGGNFTAANPGKSHIATITSGGHKFLVVWSNYSSFPLGIFYLGGDPTNTDLDSGVVVFDSPVTAVYRDKHATAIWYASPVQGRIIFGNGVDDNLVWANGQLTVLGPAAAPADPNKRSRVRIPPCTTFRQHVNRSLFAAGNAATPMRVWIADAPNMGEPFIDGIYSLATSFIDVHPLNGATRITALSVFQQYVTAHTDKAPVNLYGVDNTPDGWKCQQGASAANASAINPSCVGENLEGDAAFYLGADLEVYYDQAVRAGPFEKRSARDQDIATAQGAGLWNGSAKKPVAGEWGYHTLYDRENRLFWMFMRPVFPPNYSPNLYVFNERTRTVSGPWRYPAAFSSCLMNSFGTSVAVVFDFGNILYARLDEIGEIPPEEMEPKGTALGADFEEKDEDPEESNGLPYVMMSANNRVIIEYLNQATLGMSDMLGPLGEIDPDDFEGDDALVKYFKGAYIARFEAPWQNIGDPRRWKNFHHVELTIDRDSRAYVGIYAETDEGVRGGRWKGIVHGKQSVKVALNLAGRRIRVRVVAVLFNAGRCLIRDAAIGYTLGGTD